MKSTTGIIFDIQTYALYDGPGIRTTVFLKGCPLRCAWCHNPESWNPKPQIAYTASRCAACSACVAACPNDALEMIEDAVRRDFAECENCGACASACPNEAMEMIGHETTTQAVAEKALADMPFYEASGGGVTFTGGEPTAQFDFLLAAIKAVKEGGAHVALETCGLFAKDKLAALIEAVDLFLMDIKIIDDERHKELTGAGNELILSNFSEIVKRAGHEKVLPRIPLIPSVNAGAEEIGRIVDFLKSISHPGPVHLMPYNPLAKNKWEKLGRGGDYRDFGRLEDRDLSRVAGQFESAGFKVVINK